MNESMNRSINISPNIICAYTLNLDAVYSVVGEDINHLTRGIFPEAREKIVNLDDLISALLFCMQKGLGVELLIESEDAAKKIEDSFQWQYRLGGNAGIMANVLAALGARPILNAPALSLRLAGMLHPLVRVPVAGILKDPTAICFGSRDDAFRISVRRRRISQYD